jgi:hypothetical protein
MALGSRFFVYHHSRPACAGHGDSFLMMGINMSLRLGESHLVEKSKVTMYMYFVRKFKGCFCIFVDDISSKLIDVD